MAGGPGDGNAPGEVELDDDLGGVNPDEEQEAPEEDVDAEDGADAGRGDDGEGEDGDGEDEGQEPRQARRDVAPPRREGRYQRLANENRELRNKLSDFERNLNTLVNERRQPTAAEIAAEQERERQAFDLMTPYEQHQYTLNKTVNGLRAEYQRDRAAMLEQNDREKFEARLERQPRLRRYEAAVNDLKRQYPGVERENLLKVAIGDAALKNLERSQGRARRDADEARGRQAARPSNGRGDVRSDRTRGGAGTGNFEHLRNVNI